MNINILLIAVLILFVFMISNGYKKGFLRIAVTMMGYIIIIAAVNHLSPYVSEFLIEHTETYGEIKDKITKEFEEANRKYDNAIPDNQILTVNSYDLPDVLKSNLLINNTKEMYEKLFVNIFEEYVSAYLAKTAINAMSFVILFVLLFVAFKILLHVVDLISKIPVIKGLNKMAGAIIGLMEALVIVWVFFFIAVIFIGDNSGSVLFKMITDSKFLSYLFNSNILMKFIA